MPAPHHVFLIPGMFGFGRLAGYDYFQHLRRTIARNYELHGLPAVVEVVPTPPTASIRKRAATVARIVHTNCQDAGPIHLVGHSTGGLDARLLLSPTTSLPVNRQELSWRSRVRSLVTVNTPHHGTPLAAFFATVSGTRFLYALSLLTVTSLSLGRPGFVALSKLLAIFASLDDAVGINIHILDDATSLALRVLGDQGRREVSDWLDGIREDQGGIIQLMPEALDLFNAATEDSEKVRYGCTVSAAPPPATLPTLSRLRSPYSALSSTVYSTIYRLASRPPTRYPYPTPDAGHEEVLTKGLGEPSTDRMNDGVVPTRSMLWGRLLWAGNADHLDVVGHFAYPPEHVDWLSSGAHFDKKAFRDMVHAITHFQIHR